MKMNNHKFQVLFLFQFFGCLCLVAVLFASFVAVCLSGEFFLYANSPIDVHQPQIIKIEKGVSFYHIANNLQNEHLIGKLKYFIYLAKLLKADTRIQSGTYLLSPGMSPHYILNQLIAGNVELTRVVFPEGYTIKMIAETLEKSEIISKVDFMAYASNPSIVRSLGIDADSLEGYLFPDTYYFAKHSSAERIIKTMLKQFWHVFDASLRKRAEEIGFSIHETVTFASIVEKETGQADERPIIASVFHNRLKRNMRLESDPTVIYGVPNFDGNLTRKHLKLTTPYNTYRIKGLPCGPIANPGKNAIRATLYPESTNYLYFVSKQDGTHHFSTNLKAHNRAVNTYQKKRRSRRANNG
jgi:UPF0755 protein